MAVRGNPDPIAPIRGVLRHVSVAQAVEEAQQLAQAPPEARSTEHWARRITAQTWKALRAATIDIFALSAGSFVCAVLCALLGIVLANIDLNAKFFALGALACGVTLLLFLLSLWREGRLG